MWQEYHLCSATGIASDRRTRTFQILKSRGDSFIIHDDRGFIHPAPGNLKAIEADIRQELMDAYNVHDIVIDGSIEDQKLAASWPRNCEACANCGCAPMRRRYGGPYNGQRYCWRCRSALEYKDIALRGKIVDPNECLKIGLSKSMKLSYSAKQLEVYRCEIAKQAELRLFYLKCVEEKRCGAVSVELTDIGDLFERLLPSDPYLRAISRGIRQLDGSLEKEQRRALYSFLAALVEAKAWRFPWWEGMNAVNKHNLQNHGIT